MENVIRMGESRIRGNAPHAVQMDITDIEKIMRMTAEENYDEMRMSVAISLCDSTHGVAYHNSTADR